LIFDLPIMRVTIASTKNASNFLFLRKCTRKCSHMYKSMCVCIARIHRW